MKHIKPLIATALMLLSTVVSAQFSQPGSDNQFMLKIEGGYMPFISNVGEPDAKGYVIYGFHNASNINIMLGGNISQDWFVGGGIGVLQFSSLQQTATPMLGANVFANFDFRPIWQGVMGLDYQPVTIKWAPEIGGSLGASAIFDHPYYDLPLSPYAEIHAGVNWYYAHGLRQMTHNWHSFYLTVGLAYLQEAVYMPVRIGWRW